MPLYIKKIGSGPALVFLHGWMMSSVCWDGVVKNFSSDYQCFLVDLPGYGENINCGYSLDDARAFINGLFAELPAKASWIGWSLGGLLAQMAALINPTRVAALVSVSMGPRFPPGAVLPLSPRRFIALQTVGSENAALTRSLLKKSASLPEKRGLAFLANTDLSEPMRKREGPSLFITGERDRISDTAAVVRYVAGAPHATHVSISAAGHAPFLSHPDTFIRIARAFICRESIAALD